MSITENQIPALIKQGKPFIVGRVLMVAVDIIRAKVKDKDGNEVPGAEREAMPLRKTVIVTATQVFGLQEFGKRNSKPEDLPAIAHKTDDRVVVIIESMRRDGVGFAIDGTVQVIAEEVVTKR